MKALHELRLCGVGQELPRQGFGKRGEDESLIVKHPSQILPLLIIRQESSILPLQFLLNISDYLLDRVFPRVCSELRLQVLCHLLMELFLESRLLLDPWLTEEPAAF